MRIKKTISPTKAVILVCASIATVVLLIPQTEAFSVNFVYKDLLAHPQYDVDFLKEVVPASSVVSLSNTHRRQQRQGQAQIDTAKSSTQDQEQQQETIHESPSTMVMTDADGMRWSCMIPPKLVHEVKAPPQLTPQEIKEEERRSVQRGLELLDHLSQHCLIWRRDFWTYEYCHKKWIRQYHAVQSNGQMVPQAPENTYILALYQSEENNNKAQPNNEAALQQRSPLSTSVAQSTVTTTELGVSNDRKYLVQHWESGDICEETKMPRKVEVQFQCAPFDDRIQLVNESPICNYVMVINSPNLCKDTAFESVPAPEANKIKCKGIVSDEQYQKLKANAPETIDGATSIVQDHNAQVKIGQVPRQQPYQQQVKEEAAAATGDAQKGLNDVIAQYEVILERFMATISPEQMAMYERFENLLKGDGGKLSKEEQEEAREYWAPIDAILGAAEVAENEPQQREDLYKSVVEAIAGNDKELKKTKDGQEATTAKQLEDNPNQATIDFSELQKVLKILGESGRAGTAANAADEKQKQGQEKAKETKEEKKNAQAKP